MSSNKTKIIAFFAHKGGVSKTTNVLNTGWMLVSKFNLNVVLIDADPQCNLTQALVPSARKNQNWQSDIPNGNIYSCL